MSSNIVDIYFKSGHGTYTHQCNGFVCLDNSVFGPTLTLRDEKKNIIRTMPITASFSFEQFSNLEIASTRLAESLQKYCYVTFDGYKIRFDTNSSEAHANFVKELDAYINMNIQTRNYPSGRIHMVGAFVDDAANGEGTEYYDNDDHSIKYCGEFEDGMYDGRGTFYSIDGNIVFKANNICNGRPNGKCTIYVKMIDQDKVLKKHVFDFDDLLIDVNSGDDDFCLRLAEQFFDDINEILFESQSINKQIAQMNKQIESLLETIQRMEQRNKMGLCKKFIFYLFGY